MATKPTSTSGKTAASRAATASRRAAQSSRASRAEAPDEETPMGEGAPDDGMTSDMGTEQTPLKKKELIDRVVARSGLKKKDTKPVVEALLTVLGETLSEGREANLQPLGKIKVTRSKDLANGRVMTARIRQSGPALAELDQATAIEGEILSNSPLADGEE
ncbi:Integration host factor subunit alpha [Pseudooceanicola marinus]|uniref:Integration host factor subunit alpha n=1 Tax=Pseudooceanicola marinus TaxID=396013 RepID=A0A1X6ZD87_9RHOB|nr:HU family DNA-binding protein [Pseudooceanicola marinus]SLN47913.1 Integration host factor subunit alpha [Pseudooceanicola marinus]